MLGTRGIRHDLDFGPHGRPALHDHRHAVCAVVDLPSGVRRRPHPRDGSAGKLPAASQELALADRRGHPLKQCRPGPTAAHGARGSNPLPIENQFWVEIRPLVVATIQRLPQRTTESIRPIPGTVSPCAARQAPLGPSSTTVPPTTSRIVQPSIVVGRVSGTATGLAAAGAMLFVVNA